VGRGMVVVGVNDIDHFSECGVLWEIMKFDTAFQALQFLKSLDGSFLKQI
jgi:hypothetical protein